MHLLTICTYAQCCTLYASIKAIVNAMVNVFFSCAGIWAFFFCLVCLLSALKGAEIYSAAHSVCRSGSKHQLIA